MEVEDRGMDKSRNRTGVGQGIENLDDTDARRFENDIAGVSCKDNCFFRVKIEDDGIEASCRYREITDYLKPTLLGAGCLQGQLSGGIVRQSNIVA